MRVAQKLLLAPVIVALVVCLAIDALPETCLFHQRLKLAIDPVMDVTGLWQGSRHLFAPEVDRRNTRVSAVISFSDGSKVTWRSPDWSTMTSWRRFLSFRHMEYFDGIRQEDNRAAWDAFASYLARTVPPPDHGPAAALEVVLVGEWAEIPRPAPDAVLPALPYVNFHGRYAFHTWRAEQ